MSPALRRGENSGHEDFELGDGGGPVTDKLIGLVLERVKTATTSLMAEWELDGRALPELGSVWALIDGAGREHGVVQTREIRVLRLAESTTRSRARRAKAMRTPPSGEPATSASGPAPIRSWLSATIRSSSASASS